MMQWNLEPRYTGPRHIQLGLSRHKLKRKKLSTTKGDAKGRYKLVSYCPECPVPNQADPEMAAKAVVTGTRSKCRVSCKAGHVWIAGEGSKSD